MQFISLPNGDNVDLDTAEGCYTYVADFLTKHGADGRTLACFEKLAPPKSQWSKDLPNEQALWWWWNGDGWPIMVSILASGHGENTRYFASVGQHGWTRPQWAEEMGGWWMPCTEPEPPKE